MRLTMMVGGLILGWFTATGITAQPSQRLSRVLPLCEAVSAVDAACSAEVDFTADTALARLKDKNLVYWIDGTILRIAARGAGSKAPQLCCTFQDEMQPLSEGLWGLQYRLPHIEETILNLSLLVEGEQVDRVDYHGPKAPVTARVEALDGRTESIEIDSRYLGQVRDITVYTPAEPPPEPGYPVVYMADNAVEAFAPIVEVLIKNGSIRPVLLVGIDNGGSARMREYLRGIDPTTYDRHEAFVLNEVMPLAESRFHASRQASDRMTYGFSNGANWALAFGMKHHDRFAQASAFVVAGNPRQDYGFASAPGMRLYLGAGAYDYFNTQTSAFCRQARQTGLICNYLPLYSGHDAAMWEQGLIFALKGAFPVALKP